MVYFVEAVGTGCVKIGFSQDAITFLKRLDGFKVANPCDLLVLGVLWQEGRCKEKQLHRELTNFRVRGEWFALEAMTLLEEELSPFEYSQSELTLARSSALPQAEIPLLLSDENFVSINELPYELTDPAISAESALIEKQEDELKMKEIEKWAELSNKEAVRVGTRSNAAEIVRLKATGLTNRNIADRFGVSHQAVSKTLRKIKAKAA